MVTSYSNRDQTIEMYKDHRQLGEEKNVVFQYGYIDMMFVTKSCTEVYAKIFNRNYSLKL